MSKVVLVRRPTLLALVAWLAVASAGTGAYTTDEDVYSAMQHYGLPSGILPTEMASYSLIDDGLFSVIVGPAGCDVHAGSHVVRYDANITGKIGTRGLTGLAG